MFDATGITAEREAAYYELFTEWREDTGFFVSVAKEHGGPILEVGCGTGRDPGASARVSEKTGPDGETVRRTDRVVSRDYLNQTQQLEVTCDIRHPDGRAEYFVIPYETSYMFRFELEHLLARCGFTVRNVWGVFEFEEFGPSSSDELIILAECQAGALRPATGTVLVVFGLSRRVSRATLTRPPHSRACHLSRTRGVTPHTREGTPLP